MKCKHCKTENPFGAWYCMECGKKLFDRKEIYPNKNGGAFFFFTGF